MNDKNTPGPGSSTYDKYNYNGDHAIEMKAPLLQKTVPVRNYWL